MCFNIYIFTDKLRQLRAMHPPGTDMGYVIIPAFQWEIKTHMGSCNKDRTRVTLPEQYQRGIFSFLFFLISD